LSFKSLSAQFGFSSSFSGDTTMTSLKLKTLLASLALAASGMAAAQNALLNVS